MTRDLMKTELKRLQIKRESLLNEARRIREIADSFYAEASSCFFGAMQIERLLEMCAVIESEPETVKAALLAGKFPENDSRFSHPLRVRGDERAWNLYVREAAEVLRGEDTGT